MKKIWAGIFSSLFLSTNIMAMERDFEHKNTTKTPCPFINVVIKDLIERHKIDENAEALSVDDFIDHAHDHYGVDENFGRSLANKRADNRGNLVFRDLLDPNKFPAHKGSLARMDPQSEESFSKIELKRLKVLKNDPRFYSICPKSEPQKQISLTQLKAFQRYCWGLSDDMAFFTDKLPGKGELHLMWRTLGGYITEQRDGTETLPLDLVYNFLRYNILPEHFQKSDAPANFWNTSLSLFF